MISYTINKNNLVIGILMIIFILTMIFINYIARLDFYYGSQLFLVQLPLKYLIMNIIILLSVTYFFKKYLNSIFIGIVPFNTYKYFFLIVTIAFFFKLLLLGFNLQYDTGNNLLVKIFEQQKFNQYKLYSYIVLLFSNIFTNYEYFLVLLNILLGSISIGLIFLIFTQISATIGTIFLTTLFTLLYVPLNLIEILIRVDTLFFFLLTLSIYLGIKNMNNSNNINLMNFCISIFLLCICRESTIYLLPLFLFLTFYSCEKRVLSSLLLIIIIYYRG